jgi:TPR repeat protein
MTGYLVEKDMEKGLEWYRKAADLGNARSMYALGYAYQCGQGVETDLAEAAKWYEKAALAGHQNALQVYRVLNTQ